MNTKQLLGKRLKELIKQKGFSQEKMAEMVEIEPTALSNIVTGRNYPLFTTLEKILEVLGVSFVEVFRFEHHQTNEVLIEQIVELLKNNPDRMKDFYKIARALVE